MIDPVWLKALLKAFVLPPTGPLLAAALGLGMLGRFPRFGRALAILSVSSLILLSIPVVSDLLRQSVDGSPVLDLTRAKSAQAIVIIGGGTRRAPEYGGDTLGRLTLERVRYGARVARLTGLPVLVTGGSVFGGETEAALMRRSLEGEFGISVHWAEDRSRNTHENAVRSAAILRADGVNRVVLVAHDFDMRRAGAEFAAAGIETIAAPTGLATHEADGWLDYIPGIAGLQGSYYAMYEILANLVRTFPR